jgi:hypothetical protein
VFVAALVAGVFFLIRRRRRNSNAGWGLNRPYGDGGASAGRTEAATAGARHMTAMTTQSEIMNRAMRAAYAAESGEDRASTAYTANGYVDEKRSEAYGYGGNNYSNSRRNDDDADEDADARRFENDYRAYGYRESPSPEPGSTGRSTIRQSVRSWIRGQPSATGPPSESAILSMYAATSRRDTVRTVSMLSDDVRGEQPFVRRPSPPPLPPAYLRPGMAPPSPVRIGDGSDGNANGFPRSRWSESRWSESTSQVTSRTFPDGFEMVMAPPPPMPTQTQAQGSNGRL